MTVANARAAVLLLFCALATACSTPPRWRAEDKPTEADVAHLLGAEQSEGLSRHLRASEVPAIPVRTRFRPCCAFGSDLRVRLGSMPIPGYFVGNVLGPGDVRGHSYDSGVIRVGPSGDASGLVHREPNGLVYTCRGGFIDTAHVRDVADWTIYIATQIASQLERGAVIELPDEGGARRIVLASVEPELLAQLGRRQVSLPLAQWAAFQMSVWHEIATWYGWSTVDAFPETASAFSPEDLYSNLLGARIAAAIASSRTARSEFLYNRSVDEWLAKSLAHLGAVPAPLGREALEAVDGLWWDSSRRLPDKSLVLRRNFDIGDPVAPWLVPPERMSPALRAACGPAPEPVAIRNPPLVGKSQCGELIRVEIEAEDGILANPAFAGESVISSRDFETVVREIAQQNRREFGPGSDRPQIRFRPQAASRGGRP
ncbi:MAG: DUF4056 domain-containing protein [Proteobacteria bacterium]|nr:DUF4056 domain-containing protein [Pseudomonadota bacterium]